VIIEKQRQKLPGLVLKARFIKGLKDKGFNFRNFVNDLRNA
jgi:hypothetical protein